MTNPSPTAPFATCGECGAAVADTARHDRWHEGLDDQLEVLADGLSELTWRYLNDTGHPDPSSEHAAQGRALLAKVTIPQLTLATGDGATS